MSSEREKNEPHPLSLDELYKLSDEKIMLHLQLGHGDALRVLFDRYHRLVLHISLKILRDVAEAEDSMQSVFIEIFKHAGQFDPARGTTKVWIMRIAYHRGINHRKQLVRRQYYTNAEIGTVEESITAPGTGVLVSHEARDVIAKGFEHIRPIERSVIGLAYFQGLTMKEISVKTGESLSNVRHHYYRGLDKIRDSLGKGKEKQSVMLTSREATGC